MHTRISSFLGYQSQKITLPLSFRELLIVSTHGAGSQAPPRQPATRRLYSIVLNTFLFSEFISQMLKRKNCTSSLNRLHSWYKASLSSGWMGLWATSSSGRCPRQGCWNDPQDPLPTHTGLCFYHSGTPRSGLRAAGPPSTTRCPCRGCAPAPPGGASPPPWGHQGAGLDSRAWHRDHCSRCRRSLRWHRRGGGGGSAGLP